MRQASARLSFEDLGCDVLQVDYNSRSSLRYAVRGTDLVLSTVKGEPQLNLIKAAKHESVSRFVPAEWEGALSRRSGTDDARDGGSREALAALREAARSSRHPMKYTVFSCGLFYEWFSRGGLAVYEIASEDAFSNFQGAMFIDADTMTAQITENTSEGRTVRVSMTSVADVGRFVAAALDLGIENWENEYTLRGCQMSVRDIVATVGRVRNCEFSDPKCNSCPPTGRNYALLTHSRHDVPSCYIYSNHSVPRPERTHELFPTRSGLQHVLLV